MAASGIVVLKLGGSVITDKRTSFKAREEAIKSIAEEIARVKHPLVLIRGAGSFGHIPVLRYGLDRGLVGERQYKGFVETKLRLLELDATLLKAFGRTGIPVALFLTSSLTTAKDGRIDSMRSEPIVEALKLGFVPLLGGDVVFDSDKGVSVVSGDQVAAYLAVRLRARLLVFGTDVDGVYTADPKLGPAELIPAMTPEELEARIGSIGGAVSAPDITGGMRGKLIEALVAARAGVNVVVANLLKPGNLAGILEGDLEGCTRILASGTTR